MDKFEKLTPKLLDNNLDGIFLINETNIRYMSGFTGCESYAVLTQKEKVFITDSRYTEQAAEECHGFEIVKWRSPAAGLPETIKKVCERYGIKRLGFEKKFVTVELYERIKNCLDGVELVGTAGLIEDIRRVKTPEEISLIMKAGVFSDTAFKEILNYVKVGVTEKDIEREFQYITKKIGADDIGFDSIIASGLNSSKPHAIPSDKKIEDGDFITFDIGALYKGYRSDMTRTIVVGHASDRQREIYEIVKRSQEASEKTVKAGVDGKIPHNTARDVILKTGVEGVFEYGVGHGVGLDIHEDPFMNAANELTLLEGDVVTIEPGIYIPGWGGVRIENTVVVKKDGYDVVTLSPKELIILP